MTTNTILLILAAIVLVLYLMKRRSRLNKER